LRGFFLSAQLIIATHTTIYQQIIIASKFFFRSGPKLVKQMFNYLNKIITFAVADRIAEAPVWGNVWWDADII